MSLTMSFGLAKEEEPPTHADKRDNRQYYVISWHDLSFQFRRYEMDDDM
jgi:hypothetical protein